MESTAVCVLVLLAAVANIRAANIKYPILPVSSSRSMAAQQWNTKDAEGKTNFGYAYNGQVATNVLNADGHMVGAWSYLNPEGSLVQASYTADENGFNVFVNNLMNERSCYTMEGGIGSCMSLLSCFPTSTSSRLSHLEVWAVMTRVACNYIERDGTQTHGVCCPIKQSFDESGDLSQAGNMPFIPSIFEPSSFHYLTVASPMMVVAKETLRIPIKNPPSSTQLEKALPENTKAVWVAGPAKVLGVNDSRIAIGNPIPITGVPGMVVLKRSGQYKCGGSLIAPDKVLTAASCINYPVPGFVWQYTVELGVQFLRPTSDATLRRRVSRVEIHRNYDPLTKSSDIAMLTLYSPVTYSSKISPFSVLQPGTTDDYAGQEAAILGFGSSLDIDGPMPNALQGGMVDILSNDECQTVYSGLNETIQKSMMCADGKEAISCYGDEGGPLLTRSSIEDPWTVIGIISKKRGGCSSSQYPTIFTRLSAFTEWISERI